MEAVPTTCPRGPVRLHASRERHLPGQQFRAVTAGRHAQGPERFGTHHARDAWYLFKTMGYDIAAILDGAQAQHAVHAHDFLRCPP